MTLTDTDQGDGESRNDREPAQRPWFGPNGFGIGYRPQTWQGFVIAVIIAGLVIVIARFAQGSVASGPRLGFVI